MRMPPLDPDVADTAPSDSVLTVYDRSRPQSLRQPSRARQMDDGARVPATAPRWRVRLISPVLASEPPDVLLSQRTWPWMVVWIAAVAVIIGFVGAPLIHLIR